MHVAVVGMGALGRVYGVRLVNHAGARVTFVVKANRAPMPLRLTRIDGDGATEVLEAPTLSTFVPDDATVVMCCVRAEQLDPALDAMLQKRALPLVMMTPALPRELDKLVATYGDRVRMGMAGVVSYVNAEGVCRYWLPKVAPTLIDAAAPVPEAVEQLVQSLVRAGLPARLEPGVRETNPATTVSFIPLAMGIDAAGGIEPLMNDKPLLRLSLDAVSEGLDLAARLGKSPAWVDVLARFAGPVSLKIGVGVAKSRAPEALAYVEEHFGRKLHAQNVAMAREMVDLAKEKGTKSAALGKLLARLEGK